MTESSEEDDRPADQRLSLKEFLLAAPDLDALEIDRTREQARAVEFLTSGDDTP